MLDLVYFNPLDSGFIESTNLFKELKPWQKVASVVAGIAGAILTPFILGFGCFAAFRWTVERFSKNKDSKLGNEALKIQKILGESDKTQEVSKQQNEVLETVQLSPDDFKEQLLNQTLPLHIKIIIASDVCLRGLTSLISLPENLVVYGSIDLSECTGLTTLPEKLKVDGDLILEDCTGLRSLPKNLQVGGELILEDCTGLSSLPANLQVGGDLALRDCTGLRSIPENLQVEGDLFIENCTSLSSILENLQVVGSLFLENCTSLSSLPKNLRVGGDLTLRVCTGLSSLPANLHVERNLILGDCTRLRFLPENLHVGGSLIFLKCTGLSFLPANLQVQENLFFNGCTGLSSLPANLFVGGNLGLEGCTGLLSLPEDLHVGEDLILEDCTGLSSIPENLFVGGILSFEGCTGLSSLPANLHVGEDLDLSGCTGLLSLPEDLQVEGDLILEGCTGLRSLPENLQVGGNLILRGCTGLTPLPNSITEWGVRSDGETRIIDLTGIGLSDAVITNLQESNAEGIQFHFSQRAAQPDTEFSSIQNGLQFWAKIAQENQIPQIGSTDDAQQVCDFLGRLTTTKEYKNQHTRPYLAKRVMDVFNLMSEDSGIKEAAVDLIYHGLSTCDDRIISAFNKIELMIEVYEIETGDYQETDLKALGKSFLLLEMVNEKAKEHIQTLGFVDEIEVYLAFQLGLADRFKLPIKTRNMIFRQCADITDEKISDYGDQIEQAYSEQKLNQFLESWSPWVEFKRKSSAIPSYKDLPQDSDTKMDDKTFCLLSQGTPEEPVSYKGQVYDYEMFISQYKANGNHPINRNEKIDLTLLKRVNVVQSET